MRKKGFNSSGRNAVFHKDYTKGSIIGNVLMLSWPIIINQSLNMLGPTIDMIWVGKLGAAAIAGVGISGMAVMMANSAMMGLSMSLRAIIARFMGAGDVIGANHVARQGFFLSISSYICIGLIGFFLAEPMLIAFGVEPEVVVEGAAYLRIMFMGSITMSFRMMGEGIMQSSGDVLTPMRIAIFFRLFHVVLCPFLVLGWWIFPYMGVRGAALTNIISQGLGMAIGMWILFSGRSRLRLTLRGFRIDMNIIWRIIKIGIPASLQGMGRNLGGLVLMLLMVPFGTLGIAAHTIIHRVDGLLVMVSIGFGNSAGVLVGQNLGAKQPERAEKSGWMAANLTEVYAVICVSALLLWSEGIISIFNTDPAMIELGSSFLRIAATGLIVLGFSVTLSHCIAGAGDTLPPMLIIMISLWVIQMPLAFLLSRYSDLGIYGIRWGVVIGQLAAAVMYTTYFKMGRWKRKKV
jgi:putative MATE family efflux protein